MCNRASGRRMRAPGSRLRGIAAHLAPTAGEQAHDGEVEVAIEVGAQVDVDVVLEVEGQVVRKAI